EAEGLVFPGPQPRLLAGAPLRMEARIRFNEASRPLQLTADHRLFSLQAQAVTAAPVRATFTLRLPDLASLAAAGGQKLRGRAELKGILEQGSSTTHLSLDGTTQVADDATLLTSMLAGPSHLQIAAALTDQNLEVERLTLKGQLLSVSASG